MKTLLTGLCLLLAAASLAWANPPCGALLTGTTVLDGPMNCPGHGLRLASGSTLDCAGHTLTGLGNGSDQYGVYLDGVQHATVQGCHVSGFLRGIRVKGTGNTIRGNTLTGNGVSSSTGCGVGYGIDLAEGPVGTVIQDNTITGNGDEGIHLGTGSTGTLIEGNTIHSNDCESVYLLSATGTTIRWNILGSVTPAGAAVYHKHSTQTLIQYNQVNGQSLHIVGGSSGVTLQGNERPDGASAPVDATDCMDNQCPTPPTTLARRFTDVPTHHGFAQWIETIAVNGITTGCTPTAYCPDNAVTRSQMAVFLLRGMHGGGYQPPIATGTRFTDVPSTHPFADWIEQLAAEGITQGCQPALYCPDVAVTRDQMAVFLLRAAHGAAYQPPAATGTVFTDVPQTFWAAAWIEALFSEGITTGCGQGAYCPANPVTRGQMAVFLTRSFDLAL